MSILLPLYALGQISLGPTHYLNSRILNEKRSYHVYLPTSYSWANNRSYPVLYLLDGESQFLHTAAAVDYLASNREIPEMIVVGLNSTIRIRDFTPTDWPEMWVGGGGAPNFKRFLAEELVPAIDKKYRTDGFRVLSGTSASGLFAIYSFISADSPFQAYFAHSPSLDWDNNWPEKSLKSAIAEHRNLRGFLYVARSDDTGRPLEDFQRFVEVLRTQKPLGVRWHASEYPLETHNGVALLSEIDALRRLYEGYHFHNDFLSKGFGYAEKHFKDVSAVVGWKLEMPESVVNDLGYEALSSGNTQEALRLFKLNVQKNPNSADAHESLAEGLAKANQLRAAAAAAAKAAELAVRFSHPNRDYFLKQAKKLAGQAKHPHA